MADNARDAWNDVGERFVSWGRRLSEHYERTSRDRDETPKETQRKLEEAARDLGNEIGRALTAFGDTLNDDAAKEELKKAVGAIGEAVTVTVGEAGKAIRTRGGDPTGPPRPDRDGGSEP